MLERRPIPLHGDGHQVRDFTYVGDVVAATAAAITAPVPSGSVLNVARGEPVEVRELIDILADELGVEPSVERHPHRAGDTPRTDGCADAARELLRWEPRTDLRSGLRRQIEWHLRPRLAAVPAPAGPALSGPALAVPAEEIAVGAAVDVPVVAGLGAPGPGHDRP